MATPVIAKDKFREGFIMLLRPFQFAELKNPIQKLTILWAYSEQPIVKSHLTAEAKEKADLVVNQTGLYLNKEIKEAHIDLELERIFDNPKSYEQIYEGDVVQCYVEGHLCRFYPEEYNILSKEKLFEIMQEEGYHTIIPDEVRKLPSFAEKTHYLQSRGISQRHADKWTSLSFNSLVMYKPYFQLLDMFCRTNEIYKDSFYEEVEGINFEEILNEK